MAEGRSLDDARPAHTELAREPGGSDQASLQIRQAGVPAVEPAIPDNLDPEEEATIALHDDIYRTRLTGRRGVPARQVTYVTGP